MTNLASDPAQAERLARMREALKNQQAAHHDCGLLPEARGIMGQLSHARLNKKDQETLSTFKSRLD